MYTKFHDDTIETKFVKQLVANTNVPFISTWKPGDFAICGMLYLTKDSIYRCNHTGYPQSVLDECEISNYDITSQKINLKQYFSGGDLTDKYKNSDTKHENKIRYFTKISPYVFGEEYFNITGKYVSKIQGYDAETHFYLGQYLRMMRDIFDLDMLPFYNCYCGETIADVDFDSNSNVYTNKKSTLYKIMSVPVRFGKTYTIAFNSELPVEVISVIYGRKGIIKEKTDNLNDIADNVYQSKPTYKRFNKLSFSHPVTYRTKDWHQLYQSYIYGKYGKIVENPDGSVVADDNFYDQGLGQFEKYLRLLIKVPATNNSSLVVLEGDYSLGQPIESTNSNTVTYTNQTYADITVNSKIVSGALQRPEFITQSAVSYKDVNNNTEHYAKDVVGTKYNYVEPMLSPLGLLQLSTGEDYAFSNRLIEYLTQNVINPLDSFGKDIERVQNYASSLECLQKNGNRYSGYYVKGVWDDSLRKFLFELTKNSKVLSQSIDLSGYVDKDTELVVTRGQKV